ncbi:magnesium transporter CorA family protein [Phenylobacterium sp.]|jgi:magnesium transporter|uniref:magnesium transporter CorA family protein n=1 Tax=Phenylobacterium sp. TaxID=1871053 RepID=UPI002E37722C|nr:magnesium transporter CorA family protein [Phenylobacterium sp.]HEX4708924.1 magnesium transporter CorA family protein [Phenylobacterium sp.]
MLRLLRRGAAELEALSPAEGWRPPEDALWLDLLSPTREEELAVEGAVGLELPTREEMAAIEPSSRLYQANGATFMTATLLARRGDEGRTDAPVTFVLAKGLLITIRYDTPRAFDLFAERAPGLHVASGTEAMFHLLDTAVERLADLLEQTGKTVEGVSHAIFGRPKGAQFEALLTELARAQSLTSMTRNSLVSLARLFSFASLAKEIAQDSECRAHLRTLQRDGQSLTEHAGFQSSHIAFLLDAALGLINIEQNGIIKFFSVAAVILMPPTLVASIYGMNFHHMPELAWRFGYPMALGLMALSAIGPILWIKRRGWV